VRGASQPRILLPTDGLPPELIPSSAQDGRGLLDERGCRMERSAERLNARSWHPVRLVLISEERDGLESVLDSSVLNMCPAQICRGYPWSLLAHLSSGRCTSFPSREWCRIHPQLREHKETLSTKPYAHASTKAELFGNLDPLRKCPDAGVDGETLGL
jgi:hypothetical protein